MPEINWKNGFLRMLTFAAIAFVVSASHARAEYLEACKSELQQYCGEVVPGNGRLISCLYAHTQVASDDCFDATSEMSAQLEMFFDLIVTVTAACSDDLELYCADTSAGGGQRYSCLKENMTNLSPICSAQLNSTFRNN